MDIRKYSFRKTEPRRMNLEYMGYDVVYSPFVAHDEVLFAPINKFYINTNN